MEGARAFGDAEVVFGKLLEETFAHFHDVRRDVVHPAPHFVPVVRLHCGLGAGEEYDKVAAIHDFICRAPSQRFELGTQRGVLDHEKTPRLQPEGAGRQAAGFQNEFEIFTADFFGRVVFLAGIAAVEGFEDGLFGIRHGGLLNEAVKKGKA